jgi:hypothetical protein
MTEPNPLNPISWLVILFLGFAFFVLLAMPVTSETTASVQVLPAEPAGRPARPPMVEPPAGARRPEIANAEYLAVEKVEVAVRESAPPQVSVTVNGYWSNGCSAEPQIDTAIEGSAITVSVYRIIPPDVMCTMVIQAAEVQVDITDLLTQNNLRSGQFTVTVNGLSVGTSF